MTLSYKQTTADKVFFTSVKIKNQKMGVKKFAGEITNVQCKSQHASRKESDSGQQNSADLYYSQRCTSASSCAIKHDIFLKKNGKTDHVSPIL